MAAVPGSYYEIVPCCPIFGTQTTFFNSINGSIQNGVYRYVGTDTVINGIQFKNGYCYTITQRGNSFQSYPTIDYDDLSIVNNSCNDEKCTPCLDLCFSLTNCDTQEVIYSTLQSLIPYAVANQTVTLSGFDGCWEVNVSELPCDCSVNVIVLEVFDSCQDCLPIIAYKLTNCQNASDIKYTYEDLSEYVNQTIKSDCGCYSGELINYAPPSVTTIPILNTFTTCIECLRVYYKLTDCNDIEDPVYTYTDLSDYLNKIIKIQNCETCWEVELTEFPINPGIVILSEIFDDCADCAPELPCLCTTVTNTDTISHRYVYYDCNDEVVGFILQPGETTKKICVKSWQTRWPDTDIIKTYGDCIKYPGSETCYLYNINIPTGPIPVTLYYKDCDGNVISTPIPVRKTPVTIIACGIDNQTENDIYTVPSIPFEYLKTIVCQFPDYNCPLEVPKRKVKPGYSTPSCDIEQYEKITCKASEIYYKQVLRLRYGISNCCPEDEEKWLVKKELIDLQALFDPDYVCTPVTTCCSQPISSCGCGCNETLKTCNS